MDEMSEDSDAGPHYKRKRNSRYLDDSSSSSSSSDDSPITMSQRRRNKRTIKPLVDSSESESDTDSSHIVQRRKRSVLRVSSGSDSDTSGSSIINHKKRTGRIDSDSSTSASQWETDSDGEGTKNATVNTLSDNAIDSDSSDGQSEKCPICLLSFRQQEIGTPESCNHMFCLECIQEWSKNMNTCPVDRQEYNMILVRTNISGKVIKQIEIEKPTPQIDVNIIEDPTFCEICGLSEQEDRMLLCDGCDLGFHLFCLTPPLDDVPPGSWFCNDCAADGGHIDADISLYEVEILLDDVAGMEEPINRLRSRNSSRLVPRTIQSERVRRQIASNRMNQTRRDMPSTSSGLENRVSSTTSRKPRKKSTKKRRRKYKYVYKIDKATGETIAVKKKTSSKRRSKAAAKPKSAKKRLAVQLGMCASKTVAQSSPNVSSIGLMRQRAGIPALHLFGQRDELDYVSGDDGDYGDGVVLMRRAPNHSDVAAMRRARRKNVVVPNVVSSTNDVLGSILDCQERFHGRNTVFSVDKEGTLKMEQKSQKREFNNNYIAINQVMGVVRQRPNSYTGTTSPSSNTNNYREDTSSGGNTSTNVVEQHATPTSTMESAGTSQSGGGEDQQDMPQDYTQRTLCASYDPLPQDQEKNKTNTGSNTPNSESEIDIYSDIETVSTSKADDVDYKQQNSSPVPTQQQQQQQQQIDSNDDNDSETDMVIDTEKAAEETTVTSTVDSGNSEATAAPSYSNFASEIQSEAIQSSNQIDDAKTDDYKDQDDDDLDSEDGCPNFSIYSKESINFAKETENVLPDQSPSYDPEKPTEEDELENDEPIPTETTSADELKKNSSGLYSDSEDESIVRKENQTFAIADIRNMTEDISEEERSYTPCLDEKTSSFKEGIEGLDTEMISDEDRNDFDESHEHKTVSDGGDALEINAKESELDFTRPEDYEEGEIVDKSKRKTDAEKTDEEPVKKTKKKSDDKDDNNKENENQNKEASFKKLSKNSKDRNYRDKDRSKSRSREKKSDKNDRKERKKEKRKEIERYDVRALIAEKPRRQKDEFGRDIRQSTSRSRSRSFTPPIRKRSPTPKRTRRARSRTRSPRRRSRSKIKKKKRSVSRGRKLRLKTKKKLRSRSRNRSRSKSPKRKRPFNRRRSRDWTPSFSRSPTPEQNQSPSWTPPRLADKSPPKKQQQQHSLKVILPNDAGKKKKEKKKKATEKRKETERQQRKRRRERTPPPSKEVFASGDNILVSVSFNKENETRDVTTRDKRRKAEPPRKKKRKNKDNRRDVSGLKPVAIIDLDRSPFKEITPSPKDIIVLTDSENGDEGDIRGIQKGICDSSQQVASPERIVNSYAMGPKTPPEPQIKFSLNTKQPAVRAINNPLHEADETEPDQEGIISDSLHKGPNTPPEPPNSPPSSPDAYDPFEPTKSRSPTPEPMMQAAQSKEDISDSRGDDKIHTSPDALKSLTPPVADIQPADSQSSIHATPDTKSPERIGVVINQVLQPSSTGSKPVAQTIPFSSVPTNLINSAPITNLAPPRINIINSTIMQPSSIPQRIVLPNIQKSSPVKIPPTKSIKPMPSKNMNKNSRKNRQNGADDIIMDLDSPYSPGSSDYEDLFDPPPESKTKVKNGKSGKASKNTFDALFGSPSYNVKKKNEKVKKVQVSPTKGTKTVGVKIDEDNLKILDELPNSAVEMQVKDKYLKKLNRQERVVEEVKLVLKPHYNKKRINKEEYKDILRRSVPKICHNKSGEINPTKIKNLIEAYVKKLRHSKKVTSSSSVNPQKV